MNKTTTHATHHNTPLNGTLLLAKQGLIQGSLRVEELHQEIADKPYKNLKRIPVLKAAVAPLEHIQQRITHGIYQAVRQAGSLLLQSAIQLEQQLDEEQHPRLQRAGTDSPAGAAVQSAINGAIGDYLEQTNNALSLDMAFYQNQQALELSHEALRTAYPHATNKLCILVHGVCCNESAWQLFSEQHWQQTHVDFGQFLQRDFGYTPFYLRYNSGRHISDNGRDLDRLIEQLCEAYPVAIEDIVLIGHSMGGLVSRSATHYASTSHTQWHTKLSHVICLGSPHLGAPLEQVAHLGTALLEQLPMTQGIAKIIKQRSLGIKDLRYGYVTDEDWKDQDQDDLSGNRRIRAMQLQHVHYGFIGGSLSQSVEHPIAHSLGDLLVPVKSATGNHSEEPLAVPHSPGYFKLFGSINHLALPNHPKVYEQIKQWLSKDR